MPVINYATREVTFKIAYYGPGLSGKTTNMQYVYQRTPLDVRSQMVSLATETERMLTFDFRTGNMRGFDCQLQLNTVPGPVFYDASRVRILQGVDGIIFVADSQEARADANVECLENLETNLAIHGTTLASVPMVLQYNKRDLPEISSVEALDEMLNPGGRMWFEASAFQGVGVFDTLKAVARQVMQKLSAS